MIEFEPIGYLKCERSYHEEQPRQGNLSKAQGYIELLKGHNYEQGLKDLDGFSRIWVIYVFHQNKTWKPLANPPRTDGKGRKGVFATRSPYRPNQIGISCIKLLSIEKNKIFVSDLDLLNNTPILDIKPYIPEYDSFPDSRIGWMENILEDDYEIEYSKESEKKINFLKQYKIDLKGIIESQLGHDIFDKSRNKYIKAEEGYILRFKSWRILFEVKDKKVIIKDINSGYTDFYGLLGNDTEDDLIAHQFFKKAF
ncbi:MAG: tRNA (N6-threonylcarbamoyladenosine(37)-N6)-methyltransferase TrmO [Candidatus Riflebacteria bacterium]|nr:tRNA (N6-threonylcarbamoyladenosine(37)-N6)-methyltransferase TrmO [Candidatus Riflebacteria bacterium]